jgi:7-carboxy-7-deazaguanine synthase
MNQKDYDFAKRIIDNFNLNCSIIFQPVEGTNYTNLAEWILSDNLDVKIGLQIHKIIWGNRNGV